MMYRILMPLLVSVLLLAGCSGADEEADGNSGTPQVQKPAADLSINGRVNLGVAQGASVVIYPISAGMVDRGEPIGSATTDGLGYFSAQVGGKFSREPALIEVSLNSAEVNCIIVTGCGAGTSFAAPLPEADGAVLRLAVPNLMSSVEYQVGLLSELASAAMLAELDGIAGQVANGIGNIEAQFLISKANTRVASRFGIVADLPSARVGDITLADEVLGAGPETLFNTAFESALLGQCWTRSPAGSFAESIELCATQYVDIGFPGHLLEQDPNVSMLQVWDGVVVVFDFLQQFGRDFAVEKSAALAQVGVILSQEAGEYSKGTASTNVNLPMVDKGKYFVENVRQIASSLDLTKVVALSNLSEFVSGDAAVALEDFGVNVDTSQLLGGEKPRRAMRALGLAGLKTADVIAAYLGIDTDFVGDDLAAHHEIVGGEHVVNIAQNIDVCDEQEQVCNVYIDLQFTVTLASLGGNARANLLSLEQLTVKLDGSISQEGYEFGLLSDRVSSSINYLELRQGSGDEAGLVLLELADTNLSQPFKIWSHDAALSHLFDGVIGFDAQHLLATHRRDVESHHAEGMLHKNKKTTIDLYSLAALNANLSGKISTETGDVFYAAMNVLQSNQPFEGLLEYTSIVNERCEQPDSCDETGGESNFVGESENNFVGLTASVSYKANLQGVREPVQLQISGSRRAPDETAINSLKVTYPGHALSLNGQFNNNGGITSMNAANLDGMEMFINSRETGKRYGAVSGPGGEKVAEVVDMGEWVKIKYPDGNFVSM